MSARGRLALASLLAIAVVIGVSSGASAQTGSDFPSRSAFAPVDAPVTPSAAVGSGAFASYMRLDQALQFNVSLAAYRWLEPSMSRMDARPARAAASARQSARSAWWWKR
jgi:hypothetical protein